MSRGRLPSTYSDGRAQCPSILPLCLGFASLSSVILCYRHRLSSLCYQCDWAKNLTIAYFHILTNKCLMHATFYKTNSITSTRPLLPKQNLTSRSLNKRSEWIQSGVECCSNLLLFEVCHRELRQRDSRLEGGPPDGWCHSEEQEDDSGFSGRWFPGNRHRSVPQSHAI